MEKIREILNSNERVLVDWSIKNHCFEYIGFSEEIHEKNSLDYLKKPFLESELNNLYNFLEILEHEHSITIPEITKEIRDYTTLVSKKLSYLSDIHVFKPQKKRTVFKRESHDSSKKRLLEEIQERAFDVYNLSKRKEIHFNDEKFEILFDIIKKISNRLNFKSKTTKVFYRIPLKNNPNNYTDERVVSVLYGLSIFKQKSSVLISADTDFFRFFKRLPYLLFDDSENNKFIDSFFNNPVIFYYYERMKSDCTEPFVFSKDDEFKNRFLNKEIVQNLKLELSDLLDKLYLNES